MSAMRAFGTRGSQGDVSDAYFTGVLDGTLAVLALRARLAPSAEPWSPIASTHGVRGSSSSRVWFRPRFERGQARFGLSDKFPKTGFGARVLGKTQNSPHPHDTMAEPSHFIFNFGGHGVVGIARARPLEASQENVLGITSGAARIIETPG
jgi:hypothetical protein